MQTTTRVFISATSADLASYRAAVKEALLTNDVHPVEQASFPPDYRGVGELLSQKISTCDAVICLVGFVFGAEPLDRPADALRRSYTQLEFDTARRLGKPVYLFLAREDCAFDSRPVEDEERRQLQLAHRAAMLGGNARWEEFAAPETLRQRVAHIRFHSRSAEVRARENLPYPSLGTLFKGRQSLMDDLRQKLLAELHEQESVHGGEVMRRQVLCGLGGVGKTRLAVEYAARFKSEYSALLFVVADSPETMRRNLASLTGPMVLNLPDVQQGPEDDRIAAALKWLSDHPCWCMILDNVDTREAQRAVTELLPRFSGGHMLITSRLGETEWSRDVEPLHLGFLAPADARAFLLERTARLRRRSASDEEDAGHLAKALDGLALGLEQAGAFIERQRCSIGDYAQRWKAGESRVREWSNEALTHYPRSLAVTWDTTMRAMGPDAAALLRLFSWFAPEPIPRSILDTPVAGEVLRKLLHPGVGDSPPVHPEEALVELGAFSMVRYTEEQGEPCFSLHCVVQEITRVRIAESEWSRYLLEGIRLFLAHAPHESYRFEAWSPWRLLIPHAESLWQHSSGNPAPGADPGDKGLPRGAWSTDLLDALALYYMGQERNGEAVPLQRLTLQLKSERLEADAPSLLLAKNDLALMLEIPPATSEEKESLFVAALEGRVRRHGEMSEESGETLHNYASFLRGAGRPAEAEPLMKRSLAAHEHVNGPYHWRTLMAEMGLAHILWDRGEKARAMALVEENIAKKKSHLKENHTDTLEAYGRIAGWCAAEGDLGSAERWLLERIAGARVAYGPRHRSTLDAMSDLARVLWLRKRPGEAARLFREVLDTRGQLLGADHPETLTNVNNLAVSLANTGDLLGAQSLHERALEARRRVLGPEHPDTLLSMSELAGVLSARGEHAAARSLYEGALEARVRRLGPEHPDTLVNMGALAKVLEDEGDLAGAQSLYERALEGSERGLGPEHASTLARVNNLAVFLATIGDRARALPLYERALAGNERVLGPEHAGTLTNVHNLAILLADGGDHAAALPLFQRAVDGRQLALGPAHAETMSSMTALASTLERLGRAEESVVVQRRLLAVHAAEENLAPISLRELALSSYRLGDYALAEALLTRLLETGWDPPATRIHLARVALMTDRLADAGRHVAEAWTSRQGARDYVKARILWMQVLLALLGDPGTLPPLGRLKSTLMAGDDQEWTMQPVLDHLKPRLSQEGHALLTALVAALSFKEKVAELDGFAAWSEAEALPVEEAPPIT